MKNEERVLLTACSYFPIFCNARICTEAVKRCFFIRSQHPEWVIATNFAAYGIPTDWYPDQLIVDAGWKKVENGLDGYEQLMMEYDAFYTFAYSKSGLHLNRAELLSELCDRYDRHFSIRFL